MKPQHSATNLPTGDMHELFQPLRTLISRPESTSRIFYKPDRAYWKDKWLNTWIDISKIAQEVLNEQ